MTDQSALNPAPLNPSSTKSRSNPRGYALGLAMLMLCVGSALLLGYSYGLLINLFVLFFALPMLLTHVYQLSRQTLARRGDASIPAANGHVLAASGLSVIGVILGGLLCWLI